MRKQKRKGAASSTGSPIEGTSTSSTNDIDYSGLIPQDLDANTKEIIQKFFRNEEVPAEERLKAIDTFLLAIRKEQNEMDQDKIQQAIQSVARPVLQQEEVIFQPNPYQQPEERQRINVGWLASSIDCNDDTDEKIAPFCESLGIQQYNFVCYPIGGMQRSCWLPQKGKDCIYIPPPIWLPDLQLQTHLWEHYVSGNISAWIDCDSECEEFAVFSQNELLKELNYASYLGVQNVFIPLKRANSSKLAKVLNKWCWTKPSRISFWIVIPTSVTKFIDNPSNKDCWEVWRDFRTQCGNYTFNKLIASLQISDTIDDEFMAVHERNRWLAEAVNMIVVEDSIFITDPTTSKATIADCPKALITTLWTSNHIRILVRGSQNVQTSTHLKLAYSTACRDAVKYIKHSKSPEFFQSIDYSGVLQIPLQPFSDNLDSMIYSVFENDITKYEKYQEAIEACLTDLAETREKPETLVLYLLGAGRGPLMNAAIQAEKKFNDKHRVNKNRLVLQLYAVEKNPNALVTLHYINKIMWRGRVKIIECDMTKLKNNVELLSCPKPDIIVSELLGSFGDNELSPECLDGITFFLKPTTVSIPYSYTSYVAPLMSCYLHQKIRSAGVRSFWAKGHPGGGRETVVHEKDNSYSLTWLSNPTRPNVGIENLVYSLVKMNSNFDQLYVIAFKHACLLDRPYPLFTFKHPNFEHSTNDREARISFEKTNCNTDLMGFAGYFTMYLYKDITISIVPDQHTSEMFSWFPAVIPLRNIESISPSDQITFDIKRNSDAGGVWYEWFVEIEDMDGNKRKTALQNENGESYYLRFFDPIAKEFSGMDS